MYRDNQNKGLLTTIVVLLVLIIVCLVLLMGTILMAAQMQPVQDPVPQSSQQPEEELPVVTPPEAVQPEEPSQPESSSVQEPEPEPEKPASSAQEIVQPQPQPQASSSSSAAASKAESSSATEYQKKTYTSGGHYDSKKTYGDVTVKEGGIFIANKTIKGDMTITREAEGSVDLDHCVVEGTLYIKGGQTVVLTDSIVSEIVVKDRDGDQTIICAEGLTRTGTITAYTDLVLEEEYLDAKRTGFNKLKTVGGDDGVLVTLSRTELTEVTLGEGSEIYLDGGSTVEELRAEEDTVIDGEGWVELLVIAGDDIVSYIIPDEEKKASKRFDDVEYC